MIYFSPSRAGFYDDALRADYDAAGSWPSDAIEVSDVDHQTFTGQPPDGKRVGVVAGAPAWVTR